MPTMGTWIIIIAQVQGPYASSTNGNSDANSTIALTAQYGIYFNVGLSVR